MAYLFRSEDMQYVQITTQKDKAEFVVRRIGELGLLHIVNLADEESLKTEHMKDYKKRIVLSVQNEKRLDDIAKEMDRFKIKIPDYTPTEVKIARGCAAEFQTTWAPLEVELKINTEAVKKLQTSLSKLEEERHVLLQCKDNINLEAEVQELKLNANRRSGDMKYPLLEADIELQGMQADDLKFYKYICGVIPVAQQPPFTRMLYRLSRGNAFVRYLDISEPIIDPESGEPVNKSVFYIVSIGRGLSQKLAKLCDFFQASIYTVPDNRAGYDKRIDEICDEVLERESVMRVSKIQARKLLRKIARNDEMGRSLIQDWRLTLRKEKMLCETLIKTRRYLTMIRIDGWVPKDSLDLLKTEIDELEAPGQSGSIAIDDNYDTNDEKFRKTHGDPPTYFKTNEFSGVYQGIVNTYGVPRYKEVNPGLFTIVTFPFIFGVMYGDIGHGGALFLAACYFLFYENHYLEQQRRGQMSEMMQYVFGARYALILMGFFGFYCGTIYNDFISVPLHIFPSMWEYPANLTATDNELILKSDYKIYSYGVDWNWYHRKNELTFFNSLKMKMSVIIGVTQMTFGICLGAFNYVYFKDYLSLYFVWIPQLLFMTCTFGYMCFMIIYKWCVNWINIGQQPPALIQTMIKMFLSPGAIEDPLYPGQAGVQVTLLLIAVATVPVMLLVKPIAKHKGHKDEAHQPLAARENSIAGDSVIGAEDEGADEKLDFRPSHDPEANKEAEHEEGEGHSLSAELIHSGIHTIEFVLGAVSNTASYLRLWALSLAHAQLAKVFWQKMIIEYGVQTYNPLLVIATYALWFCATFAVLMCMDLLECFLHALRLHWVEFQNKFFNADGYLFEPFNFDAKDDD